MLVPIGARIGISRFLVSCPGEPKLLNSDAHGERADTKAQDETHQARIMKNVSELRDRALQGNRERRSCCLAVGLCQGVSDRPLTAGSSPL